MPSLRNALSIVLVAPSIERGLRSPARPAFQGRVRWNASQASDAIVPHALSNSAEATSTVSVGQAIANSNGFIGRIDPAEPLTIIRLG